MTNGDGEPKHGMLGFPDGELDNVEWADAAEFAGVPDELQRTWVPHRMTYIANGEERKKPSSACPFCEIPKKDDREALIVARGEFAYVVMNLYPYNSGHLLVCPYRHIPTYDLATTEEVLDIARLTQEAMGVITQVAHSAGFNIGMNQGEVAGAGVAGHLHQHVVPRWFGDSNFLPIIGKTKPVPQLLGDLRELLAEAWPSESAPNSSLTT